MHALSDDQFRKWRKLLESKTGVHLTEQQKLMLQTALNIRMREVGINGYDEYFGQMDDGLQGIVEWCKLVDRVMVNETRFFRDTDSYAFVEKFFTQKLESNSLDSPFELWCVGCSTGEEPYSLAMLVSDCFEKAGLESLYGITATDISLEALAVARLAKYKSRQTKLLPTNFRERYFNEIDANYDQVCPELRDRICFTHGNVVELKEWPIGNMDIIFCHNMLIYFRRWRRKEILWQLAERLKVGGVLIIAVGEIVDWEHPNLERVSKENIQAYIRRF